MSSQVVPTWKISILPEKAPAWLLHGAYVALPKL